MEIEAIVERSSKLNSKKELELTKKQFGTKGTDSYVRKNSGVCFIMGSDSTYEIFNPRFSIIESRDAYDSVLEHGTRNQKLAYKILNRHVQFHEAIHANQVDSPLIWREMLNYAGTYYLDMAIKAQERGELDVEPAEEKFKHLLHGERETNRNLLINYLDLNAMQALGKGELAQSMRDSGTHVTRMDNGIEIIKGVGKRDIEALRGYIPMESLDDCLTKQNYLKVRSALFGANTEHMKHIHKKMEGFSQEMLGVIETMAEAFAFEVDKDFIMNFPDGRLSRKRRGEFCQSLQERLCGKGIRAKRFLEASETKSKKERDQELARHGLKYQQTIGSKEHEGPIENTLMDLGYDPINPHEAYGSMKKLQARSAEAGIDIKDLLFPINAASALVGERYNSHLPEFIDHIQRHGSKQSFKNMLQAETFSDVENN